MGYSAAKEQGPLLNLAYSGRSESLSDVRRARPGFAEQRSVLRWTPGNRTPSGQIEVMRVDEKPQELRTNSKCELFAKPCFMPGRHGERAHHQKSPASRELPISAMLSYDGAHCFFPIEAT